MTVVLLFLVTTVMGLTDEKQVVEEIIERDKCETCCRVVFAMEYNPVTKQKIGETDEQYVMDVEFKDINSLRIDIDADNLQHMKLRKLELQRDMQFWEFASYQMFCMYSYPNRVMDILYNTKFESPLIVWRRKDPLDYNTNNQRFTYIYDYDFMDDRHKPYAKSFMAEYYEIKDCNNPWNDWYCNEHQVNYNKKKYNGKEMCFAVNDDNQTSLNNIDNKHQKNVRCNCGNAYNKQACDDSLYCQGLWAQDCKYEGEEEDGYKLQKFIPVFA